MMRHDEKKKNIISAAAIILLLLFSISAMMVIVFPGTAVSLLPGLPLSKEIMIRERQIQELINELKTLREAEEEKDEEIYELNGRLSLLIKRIIRLESQAQQAAGIDEAESGPPQEKNPLIIIID